jgi:hypothetical protein
MMELERSFFPVVGGGEVRCLSYLERCSRLSSVRLSVSVETEGGNVWYVLVCAPASCRSPAQCCPPSPPMLPPFPPQCCPPPPSPQARLARMQFWPYFETSPEAARPTYDVRKTSLKIPKSPSYL